MSLDRINRKILELEKSKEKLNQEKKQIVRKYMILCTACHKRSALGKWKLVQYLFYIRPYGIDGGRILDRSATEYCHIICPFCKYEDYISNYPQKEKLVQLIDESSFLKSDIFAEVEERHSR